MEKMKGVLPLSHRFKSVLQIFISIYSLALAVLLSFVISLGAIIYNAPPLSKLTNITADTVTFDTVPAFVSGAFLAAEDIRYFDRPGMETRAVLKSLIRAGIGRNELPQEITVVQKLVTYAFDKPEKTFKQHLQEAYLAFMLENSFNRKQILQMYINHTSFGNNTFGISSASFYYFGKRPKDLTAGEVAFLAAVSKDPNSFSENNFKKAYELRNSILVSMQKNGLINNETYLSAEKEAINLNIKPDQPAKAFEVKN